MKVLSLYLPAYHRVKENDEWWGEGFTEWDNVRSAKPLFKGHEQPLVPLDNYYYDLSKAEDIIKQINMAKKYKVDGFIFYHYWFDTHRMMLEKPAEILRDEITDKIDYCFCWANQSWTSTWHGRETKVLIEQKYLGEEDWIEHIKYLYTFFQDDRYIKIDR